MSAPGESEVNLLPSVATRGGVGVGKSKKRGRPSVFAECARGCVVRWACEKFDVLYLALEAWRVAAILEEEISRHPGNKSSTYHVKDAPGDVLEDLKRKRARVRELKGLRTED